MPFKKNVSILFTCSLFLILSLQAYAVSPQSQQTSTQADETIESNNKTSQSNSGQVSDPFEPVNRKIWSFNSYFDRWIMRPVAQSYRYVTPNFVERGVSNFFSNLGNVPTAMNNLLQGNPGKAGQDISRFVFNLTFGGLGLYDISTTFGLPVHTEDFGQTLGFWGLDSGPYIVLPLLGPSSLRDGIALPLDYETDQTEQFGSSHEQFGMKALNIINLRASFLSLDNIAPGDDYLFFRDSYLQRRASQVRNGAAKEEDEFLQDDFF